MFMDGWGQTDLRTTCHPISFPELYSGEIKIMKRAVYQIVVGTHHCSQIFVKGDEAITSIRLDFTVTIVKQKSGKLVCTMMLFVQARIGTEGYIFFFNISS